MYILIAALKDEVTLITELEKDHIVISGIGKLNAMLALSERFQNSKEPVTCVINLGTVGSVRVEGGQLVEITKSFQRDTTFFSEPISLKGYTHLPKVSCGSSDMVETSKERDAWDVVDMELYSLALYCQRKQIPLVSIKYVTDRNGVNVYKDWKKILPLASQSLSEFWIDQKHRILSQLCTK